MVHALSGPSREGLTASSSGGSPLSLPLPGLVERGGVRGAVRTGARRPSFVLRVTLCLLCLPSAYRQRPASAPGVPGSSVPWVLSLSEPRTCPSSLRLSLPSDLAALTAAPGESLPLADASGLRAVP